MNMLEIHVTDVKRDNKDWQQRDKRNYGLTKPDGADFYDVDGRMITWIY